MRGGQHGGKAGLAILRDAEISVSVLRKENVSGDATSEQEALLKQRNQKLKDALAEMKQKLKIRRADVLKHRQIQKWFPDSDIVVLRPAAVTPPVSDEGARAVLIEVGFPENLYDVLNLHNRLPDEVTTIGEAYAQQDAQAPASTEGLLYLGFAGQRFLALNGQSGEVSQVHGDFGARPFAPGLESFVRALGTVNNRVRKSLNKGRGLTVEQLLAEVSKEFPLADTEHAWRDFLADIVASAQ